MERPNQTRISSEINDFKNIDEAIRRVQDMFDHIYFYGDPNYTFRIKIITHDPVYLSVHFDIRYNHCNGDRRRSVFAVIKEIVERFTVQTKSFYYSITTFTGENPIEEEIQENKKCISKEDVENIIKKVKYKGKNKNKKTDKIEIQGYDEDEDEDEDDENSHEKSVLSSVKNSDF